MKPDYSNYLSPFSWRYGTKEMRFIFSEKHKYEIWRKIWISLADAEYYAGIVTKKELDDLKKHEKDIDIDRLLEIEKQTGHDLVAGIREFAEKAKIGGGKIHAGATSMDIVDNTDTIRMKEAIDVIEKKVKALLFIFEQKITQYAHLPCMAFTHLQPAEPTTLGYRFAFYAQDLLLDYEHLLFVKKILKAKGMKGAVGTAASYTSLVKGTKISATQLEEKIMKLLNLEAFDISTQVYPRKVDYLVLSALASIAQSLSKFAADVRILQSPTNGEWSEPFGKTQVGSSAMPFKRNPINCEKICSLARYISQLPPIALENAAVSYLERTIDESANKRIIIAEAFLALDEVLKTSEKVISGLVINEHKITYNLQQFAPFAATESILMEIVKKGGNRQIIHEVLREVAMKAWTDVQNGKVNPMSKLLTSNKNLKDYLSEKEITDLLDVSDHIGNAPDRALKLAKKIRKLK